ncbi:uncharacterized protein LOC115032386 [Mus caroli]|uniref:Uncharacterized protein LOC115032386 n=1 Tax=Mus caroli TaxID=10089 RepID=A0A6P7RWY3_MUSCR|nr:uncharacterized protein LOC115032386 [Mus caroli]
MPRPAVPLGCDSKLDGRRMRYVSPASEHLEAVPRQGFPGKKTGKRRKRRNPGWHQLKVLCAATWCLMPSLHGCHRGGAGWRLSRGNHRAPDNVGRTDEENDDEVKGENKLHDSFQNGSCFPLKMGRRWVVIHSRHGPQLVLYKREYN